MANGKLPLDSYIKADDPSNFAEVIEIANHAGKYDDLVRFLQMARKSLREPKIDTELAYAYAKTDRLHDMEDFLNFTNVADILEVGEKCFEDELYQAAKLLFTSISNWARLATTLIYLGENQAAVESARKAGNTQYAYVKLNLDSRLTIHQGLEAGTCCMLGEIRVPSCEFHDILSDVLAGFKCNRLKFAASTSSFMQRNFPL